MEENKKPHVLVVDDNDAGRYATISVLKQNGFEILEAVNGRECLEKVLHQPALVLLDVNLPDMSGFDVCSAIRKNSKTASIPIIYLSATRRDSKSKVYGLNSGADGYIFQPVEPIELVASINALLRMKHAEQLAIKETRQWHSTFNAIADAIALIDINGKILRYNTSFEMMVGKTKKSLVGQFCYKVVNGTTDFIENCPTLKTLKSYKQETAVVAIGNKYFHIIIDPIFDESGKIVSLVHIMRDITERKNLNEDLKKAKDDAIKANKAKSEFLAKMSHELRTPLNSIIGFNNIMLKNKNKNLLDQDIQYLQIIHKNSINLIMLVNDILNLAKVESGKIKLNKKIVSLKNIIDDVKLQVQGQLLGKKVPIFIEIPENIAAIEIDEIRFGQVLLNIVGNAVKFTEEGKIIIHVETDKKTNVLLRIDVIDSGIGIPKDKIDTIFDSFEQVDSFINRTHPGTGLGLSIAKSILSFKNQNRTLFDGFKNQNRTSLW